MKIGVFVCSVLHQEHVVQHHTSYSHINTLLKFGAYKSRQKNGTSLDIYLHIGHFKTGSTSLQNTLSKHRQELLDYNVFYPVGTNPINHQHGLELVPFVRENPDADIKSVLKSWLCSDYDTLILSAEGLSNVRPGRGVKLVNILAEFGDVHIIYTIRHWAEYLPSRYRQNMKQGDCWKLHDFLQACHRTFTFNSDLNYALNISEYKNANISSFVLLPYNTESSLTDILKNMGLSDVTGLKPYFQNKHYSQRYNKSTSEIEAEIMRLIVSVYHNLNDFSPRFDSLITYEKLTPMPAFKKKLQQYFLKNQYREELVELIRNSYEEQNIITDDIALSWETELKSVLGGTLNLSLPEDWFGQNISHLRLGCTLGHEHLPDYILKDLRI